MKSVSYDLGRDFDPIVLVGLTQFCLVVSPSLPVSSVADLIALAKEKPGALTYASAGIATPHQIFAEQFKLATGVDIRHIPYKGAMPGLTDVASGNVSMEFSDLTPALPLIQAGKLKLLAVLSASRDPDMPNVPALSETVPGYDGSSWQGFLPARERRNRLSARSIPLLSPISNGRKRRRVSRRSASSRNGTRRLNSALSSPRRRQNGSSIIHTAHIEMQ